MRSAFGSVDFLLTVAALQAAGQARTELARGDSPVINVDGILEPERTAFVIRLGQLLRGDTARVRIEEAGEMKPLGTP